MKAVLISIKPKYCELIANGKKTVEVRKTKPKIDEPFKCYIYCTKSKNEFLQSRSNMFFYCENKDFIGGHGSGAYRRLNGTVIGEFVCDKFYDIIQYGIGAKVCTDNLETVVEPSEFIEMSCLSEEQIFEYIGNKDGYGWHITDLVIYDKPKELGEFKIVGCKGCRDKDTYHCKFWCKGERKITRPPQSWCYVEELGA